MTGALALQRYDVDAVDDRPICLVRRFFLHAIGQLHRVQAALTHAPLDPVRPLEVIIQESDETRGKDANALMWSGTLHDIEQQAWVCDANGKSRRYRGEVWHEMFKDEFLPEYFIQGITRKGYVKWAMDPSGKRRLVGSTKNLTKKGFALYLTEVEAYGANLGVQYHANPNEVPRMP